MVSMFANFRMVNLLCLYKTQLNKLADRFIDWTIKGYLWLLKGRMEVLRSLNRSIKLWFSRFLLLLQQVLVYVNFGELFDMHLILAIFAQMLDQVVREFLDNTMSVDIMTGKDFIRIYFWCLDKIIKMHLNEVFFVLLFVGDVHAVTVFNLMFLPLLVLDNQIIVEGEIIKLSQIQRKIHTVALV